MKKKRKEWYESVQGTEEENCTNNDEERKNGTVIYRVKKWLEKAEWRLEKGRQGEERKLTD